MLDLSDRVKRTFDVKVGGTVFKLKSPKLKTLKKAEAMKDDDSLEGMSALAVLLLSTNKAGKKVDTEFADEHLDSDDLEDLAVGYFSWVNGVTSDPN